MTSFHYAENNAAPWVVIPEINITSVEHPCIVKNSLKAIDMLGGSQSIAQMLDQSTQQTLSLTFSPKDPTSRTILSLHNDTSNILLEVTVPKRTGRRRKRGSTENFSEDVTGRATIKDATYLVDSLTHNPNKSAVEAVGNIKSCHVWRAIPDFAYYTKASNFLRSIETQLLPQQYPRLKQWSLPRTYGLEDTEMIPPPVISTQSLSHNYTYRQNPAVRAYADPTTGDRVLLNTSAPSKLHIQILMYDEPTYPSAPLPECPPLEEQPKPLQKLVQQLKEIFEKRPIWTRRALVNSLPLSATDSLVRVAAAYVCYSLRSGPWRDAYVRLGVDPRTDPKYRKFQTILLKLLPKGKSSLEKRSLLYRVWARSPDPESHIFTGTKAVPADGKTWQLCDLQDPALKQLVDVPDLYIRAECETRYFGWYQNGTSAKLRVLLKAKIDELALGNQLDPAMVQSFMQLPEHWVPGTKPNGTFDPAMGYLSEKSSTKALEWASAYRSICRTSAGYLPNFGGGGKGRLSKPKPKNRPSYIGPEGESDGDEAGQQLEQDAEVAAEYEEPEDDDDDDDDEELGAENNGAAEEAGAGILSNSATIPENTGDTPIGH